MQDIVNLLAQVAGLGALLLIVAAGYYLYRTMRARKESRSALFGAERQSAADRAIRAFLTTLGLVGLALVLFGIALLGETQPTSPVTPGTTVTPTPTRGAVQPSVATFTPAPGGQPTVPVETPAVDAPPTPVPATPTEAGPARKTAVVSGVGENLLKLRREPTTNADIIAQYPDGTVLEVLDEQQTNQGIVWQHVRDPQGNDGWVANQYLVYNP